MARKRTKKTCCDKTSFQTSGTYFAVKVTQHLQCTVRPKEKRNSSNDTDNEINKSSITLTEVILFANANTKCAN